MNIQNALMWLTSARSKMTRWSKPGEMAGFWLSAQLTRLVREKLADRFLHAFYLDSIANPFRLVTQP